MQFRKILGKKVCEALPELVLQGFVSLLDEVFITGERYAASNTPVKLQLTPNAAPISYTMNFIFEPIKDALGCVTGIFFQGQDVTAETQALQAVQAAHKRYRRILDAMSEGFVVLDEQYRVTEINAEGLRLDGRALEAMRYQTIWQLWPATVGTRVETAYRAAMERRQKQSLVYNFSSETYDIWLDLRIYPVDGGGVAAFYRDVSDAKRDELALRQADRRKDDFLATLAHELRNPLAPIQNGLEVLRLAGNNPETAAKVRGMMQRQVSHMVHLVEDLLDVARINSGKVELRKEKVELKSIVTHAVESNLAAMEAAHHVLDLRITDESLVVDADPVRLVQVLGNLLTNAAKYTPEHGRIELSVRRDEQHAVIAVTDNGIGIALHAMPSLFDMFTQVPSGAARSQGGLGIGLSLVQRLVAMHGGTVTAASPGEGQGSTFTVRLPVVDQPQVNARPSQNQVAPIGQTALRLKVLVADDNIDAAESLAALLALCGHETTVAHDGHAALRWVVEGRPDVAFLDIGMPGLTGYEVARMVRQTSGVDQTVLVALTGWGADHDQDQARQAGFNHHLTKPADIAAIDALLAAHSARAAT